MKFGCLPDPEYDSELRGSFRYKQDHPYQPYAVDMSGTIDLRDYASSVADQGQTGSCVAQAVVSALELKRNMAGLPHIDLSVSGLYYACRSRMNPRQEHVDEGTYIWLACKTLKDIGIAPDSYWPFDPDRLFTNPGIDYWEKCAVHQISSYKKITSTGTARVLDIKAALLSGNPVVYGLDVGSDWDRYRSGTLGIESKPRGGHATTLLGHNGSEFIGMNSWGPYWGLNGFYRISEEAIAGCFNPWVIYGNF